VPVIELIGRVRRRHADQAKTLPLKLMDARPLPVGNSSQDRGGIERTFSHSTFM